jgi:hypothetical protein
MLVSCLCVCHAKPDFAHEAIDSIVGQEYPHWQAIIIDSGVLHDTGYYDRFLWRTDPRLQLVRSGETHETQGTKAMAPWCFNECFRRGLVRGDLVTYLCDDDLFYPNAFATIVAFFRRRPDAMAVYASQDIGVVYPDGSRAVIGERRARLPGGLACQGRVMDGEVDYLQFCHRAQVLRYFPNDEYWPESKTTESHADGLFMERVGDVVPILPIDVKIAQNRRTLASLYTPFRSLADMERILKGQKKAGAAS